jgi:hypothetical protein
MRLSAAYLVRVAVGLIVFGCLPAGPVWAVTPISPAPTPASFHVAPGGDDSNPGTAEKPFASIERARDAARAMKAATGLPEGGIEIVLHGGQYVLRQTLVLTPQDSGAKYRPIRYVAAKGELPAITSATPITGWKPLTESNPAVAAAAKGKLWFASVPKGWRFHFLYIDGQSQQVSRYPNTGLKQWRKTWPRATGKGEITPQGTWLNLPGGVPQNLPVNGDVEVNFLPLEYWNTLAVLHKTAGNTILIGSRNPCTQVWPDGRCFYEGALCFRNALALIDQPGQWCVDSAAGRVYYWPPDGDMKGKTVTAPSLYELIRLQGDDLAARSNQWRVKYDVQGNRVEKDTPPPADVSAASFKQLVRRVEFAGLTFEQTDRMPEDQWPQDWLKRNCENPDGALFLQGVEDCAIHDCVFHDCGGYAVAMDHYAQRVSLLGNEMYDLASGGIQATGYGPGTLDVNGHHAIRRNYIHHTGMDYMHSAAVTLFGSGNNDISLNWFSDVPYVAVQISSANQTILNCASDRFHGPSTDLYGNSDAQFQMRTHELPAPSNKDDPADFEEAKVYLHTAANWIARNVIDEYMTTLGDGGALYAWGPDHGTVILLNAMKRHDHRTNAWTVYMDDWTGRTVVESNVAWAAAHNGPKGSWFCHSHTPPPASRPIAMRSQGTVPPVQVGQPGETLTEWRNNVSSFPEKPAGFAELVDAIQADAAVEGGWPKSVTAAMIRKYRDAPPR